VSLSLERPVYFQAAEKVFVTTGSTWERGAAGTHAGDSRNIIQSLEKLLQNFLEIYLQINKK
jgi:hypothetical protein